LNEVFKILESVYNSHFVEESKHFSLQGMSCVSDSEKSQAREDNHSLLYGEILPLGLIELFQPDLLDISKATCVLDVGAGLGKNSFCTFLLYPKFPEKDHNYRY